MNDSDDGTRMRLDQIMSEPGADDLMESEQMQPYLRLAMAILGGQDATPAVNVIAALPLEKRYVWRIASALKWAFADFDDGQCRCGS